MEGKKGYVYFANIFNSSYSTAYLYVKLNGFNSAYTYHFLEEPTNSSELLAQTNAEGRSGYRLKRRLFYQTGNINVYVRSARRSSAKYTYRHLPAAQNPEEFLNLINKQGAHGYRYWGIFNLGDLSTLFIKDKSQNSQFVYKTVSLEASSAEFLQNANDLGLTGYRLLSITFLTNPTYPLPSGSPRFWQFSLYSKDLSNRSSMFSYAIPAKPVTFDEYTKQLETQGSKGFFYITYNTYAEGDSVAIYMNLDKCRCGKLDLDGSF